MAPSQPLLLPLKTHWHFRKCHRFTSFSEDLFGWWCSWVIRQRPPRAPSHSGIERREWEINGKERMTEFQETGWQFISVTIYMHKPPERNLCLSSSEIWRVAIYTTDLFTALYCCVFVFPKHYKHPSASHSPRWPFDLSLCCFDKANGSKNVLKL